LEASPEEIVSEAKNEEVPKEEAAVETFGALKEQYGIWNRDLKKWLYRGSERTSVRIRKMSDRTLWRG
jgi:hypothetical protein